jgi:hypothetical protein
MKIPVILTCVLLVTCGESEDAKRAQERETVFDPLMQQVDKAKAVEEIVEQHKRDLDEALGKTDGRDDH